MTTIHCNRCDKPFEVETATRGKFHGSAAARVREFHTCPHCGRMDSHWVFASDIMPEGLTKKQQTAWLDSN
jgi:hypothetical protein